MRKLARFEGLRYIIEATTPSSVSVPHGEETSMFEGLDIATAVQAIRQTGYYDQLQLPPAIVKELLQFCQSSICYGDRRPDVPFYLSQRSKVEERLNKALMIGSYLNTHEECPAFQAIKTDPGLLALARAYLGCEPVYLAGELFWSFPRESSEIEKLKAAQVFHYDIDDYRSLKLFFYLTDVDESAGPHVCIKGSHVRKRLYHQILGQRVASIDDATLVNHYGAENVAVLCGQAGFGFAEDPYCLHKGTLPTEKPRLLLQLQFNQRYYPDIRVHQGAPT
ncbi:MAG: hypothetical protein IGR76_11975 [Synechococcales cyanobacterium T60_A2020_003]|nr:hypothetical protein [Synechococcales cyanobacterium T60_A2020_003]